MTKAQKKYMKDKVTTKRVDFYIKDTELLQFIKKINFSKFVKDKIREEIKKNG